MFPLAAWLTTVPLRRVAKSPRAQRWRWSVSVMTVCAVLALLIGPAPVPLAHAAVDATFVVNDAGDAGDAAAGDGVCATAGAVCTLRAAIEESNSFAGTETIQFSIGGGGAQTISPGSELPEIKGVVSIDGTTQPGFAGVPLIELDGTNAGLPSDGLRINAGTSTVRGLIINRFSGNGIRLIVNGSNVIQGNRIGTDASGTLALPNGVDGVSVFQATGNQIVDNLISGNTRNGVLIDGATAAGNAVQGNRIGTTAGGTAALANGGSGVEIFDGSNNQIGGTGPGTGNLISGNAVDGVLIRGAVATGNVVQGNVIGANPGGTAAVGNVRTGVRIEASNTVIGGTTTAARNLISGNGEHGIRIIGSAAAGNIVRGNFIGTTGTGNAALGNLLTGVRVEGSDNLIGGLGGAARNLISGNAAEGVRVDGPTATGNRIQGNLIGTNQAGTAAVGNGASGVRISGGASQTRVNFRNTIAFNAGAGVFVQAGVRNPIRINSIFGNGGLGIDLSPIGVTPNDAGDGDGGPNARQNFPVLTGIVISNTNRLLQGTLNSLANTTFTIDVYNNVSAVSTDEGEDYLGFVKVKTDASGNASFNFLLPPLPSVPIGSFLTATSTGPLLNTSEFSNPPLQVSQ